ncbi:hypothetical protein SY88_07440 [Clostridiales bacterium PH28_bin88]|nr:hypothetical protein SY88_07440 [Clostridiales bacterium PH28_bin88]
MKLDPAIAQTVIDHLDTVAITDPEGRYIYVNQGWVDWIGMQPEEVLGRYVREVVPESKIDIVLKTKKPLIGEVLFPSKSGDKTRARVIVTYIPLMKDNEVIAGLVFSIFRDFEVALSFTQKIDHLTNELNYYKDELRKLRGSRYTVENIIGNSQAISKLKEQIFQAARSNSTVLIRGETGTGKELVAHAIHNSSSRSAFNFIKINCAAIPTDLLEAELFGYEEGAFTGAVKGGRTGKFEMAHMGSLFLDEINQMPLALQPKLLRVLQEREVDRLGGKASIPVNVRVIAASNVSLKKLVQDNKFREDLFYRLNVMEIKVPPLRERKEDIPLLAAELLKRLNQQMGVKIKTIKPQVMRMLLKYDWPGNVRELQNALERAMNIAWGEVLEEKHFEWFIENKRKKIPYLISSTDSINTLQEMKSMTEKKAILDALEKYNGVKAHVAQHLGISRAMLYRKMRKYGI